MKVFCYIPQACISGVGDAAPQIRAQLAEALAAKLKPAGPAKDLQRIAVTFDEPVALALHRMGGQYGLAPGRIAGGLIYALHLSKQPNSRMSTARSGDHLRPDVGGLRPGQVQCLTELGPLMHAGKVVMAECGTGSGKSRMIAHAAAYALRLRDAGVLRMPKEVDDSPRLGPKIQGELPEFIRKHARIAQTQVAQRLETKTSPGPVIICAPSIENLTHLVREWSGCRDNLTLPPGAQMTVALGRGQFVDGALLTEMLDSSEEPHPEVEKWLQEGMPAGKSAATAHLLTLEPALCGLLADLEVVSRDSGFAFRDAMLDEDAGEESAAVFRALRQKCQTADIIFTTHAMLCIDNLALASSALSGVLPSPCALLIDEAHEIEKSQAEMAGADLSFLRLLSALNDPLWAQHRRVSAASECATAVRALVGLLGKIPNETPLPVNEEDVDSETFRIWQGAQPAVTRLQAKLQKLYKGIRAEGLPGRSLRALRYAERAASVLQNLGKNYGGYIGHSPVQGRISFHIGPSSVEKYLAARWETTPTSVLFSGTLMHLSLNGYSPHIFARSVAISPERLAVTTPIHPTWLTSTPTLFQPSEQSYHRLIPPRPDDVNPVSMAFWMSSVAEAVHLAASEAEGGMLVLLTGYERLDYLATALTDRRPELAPRLIVQARHQGVSACASLFKDMARDGRKPIWLATGAAWTGLDLADDAIPDDRAHEDNLLTDLVIPAIPFGLDKTTTHVSRVAKVGFTVESVATQRRLRQALGRLVRRQGLKNRKIWMLDGRLQMYTSANYTALLRRVLVAYLHRETFDI